MTIPTRQLYFLYGLGDGRSYQAIPEKTNDPQKANLISSEIEGSKCSDGFPMHMPVIDIDLPIRVVPSETEGHHHLFIDYPLEWADYVKLLRVLVEIGLVERNYLEASLKARATFVAPKPWKNPDQKSDKPKKVMPSGVASGVAIDMNMLAATTTQAENSFKEFMNHLEQDDDIAF